MIHIITVAFCPAAQLARSLELYRRYGQIEDARHVVVQGHYPINKRKNNRDIEMICDAFGVEFLDPGEDLGSAQSQNWALAAVSAKQTDIFINLDPDSACTVPGWDSLLVRAAARDKECAVMSLWSRQWDAFKSRVSPHPVETNCANIGYATAPMPFNMSAFKVDFVQKMGGLRQIGEKWGDLEAHVHAACVKLGMYHGYLMDVQEDYSAKYMQDRPLLEYKDAYMRTAPPDNFMGTYEEFLRFKYPELLKADTFIPEGTDFK